MKDAPLSGGKFTKLHKRWWDCGKFLNDYWRLDGGRCWVSGFMFGNLPRKKSPWVL
jgi:hypothetical protein